MACVRLKVAESEREGLSYNLWNDIQRIPESILARSPELVRAKKSGVLKVWIEEQVDEFLWFDWFDREGGSL